MKSVLQDWVMELPLRYQGTLMAATRGCDTTPKPAQAGMATIERHLTAYLRWTFMNPADEREVDVPGAFMRSTIAHTTNGWKASELGHLPQHYYAHLMHAFEVVAYKHPNESIRGICLGIYMRMVHNLHLMPESEIDLHIRMVQDRFEAGTIVS